MKILKKWPVIVAGIMFLASLVAMVIAICNLGYRNEVYKGLHSNKWVWINTEVTDTYINSNLGTTYIHYELDGADHGTLLGSNDHYMTIDWEYKAGHTPENGTAMTVLVNAETGVSFSDWLLNAGVWNMGFLFVPLIGAFLVMTIRLVKKGELG